MIKRISLLLAAALLAVAMTMGSALPAFAASLNKNDCPTDTDASDGTTQTYVHNGNDKECVTTTTTSDDAGKSGKNFFTSTDTTTQSKNPDNETGGGTVEESTVNGPCKNNQGHENQSANCS